MTPIDKMLPEFPIFRPFTIDDTAWYSDYYLKEGLNPYADISPGDLLVWFDINNDLSVSILDGTVILRYSNIFDGGRINIIPLKNSLTDTVVERIMIFLQDSNLKLELREIPSTTCNILDRNKWIITDDRDSYEYILDTLQQSRLQGSDFYRQRNTIRSFENGHSEDAIEIIYCPEFTDDLRSAFLQHIKTMPFNYREELSLQNKMEPIAIRKNLGYATFFNKKALLIKINGEIVSLSIISILDKSTAAINHLKVNYSIKNIFRYTVYQLAKVLRDKGIDEINFEQDLGIVGLRTYKLLMRPSRFLEKKIIRPHD